VVYVSGINTVEGDSTSRFALLTAKLRQSFGFQSNDFFQFSYAGWRVEAGSNYMNLFHFEHPESCRAMDSAEPLLTGMLRYMKQNHWADHVVVVGHSRGGLIGMLTLSRAPDLTDGPDPFLRTVITVDSPLHGIDPIKRTWYNVGASACEPAMGELAAMSGSFKQWDQWLGTTANWAGNRRVNLMAFANEYDCLFAPSRCPNALGGWAGLGNAIIGAPDEFASQQIPGPFNFFYPTEGLSFNESHSAILRSDAAVSRMALGIGPQGQ
jgi:pimeloyl-ACP methyl ester carboxylesterase